MRRPTYLRPGVIADRLHTRTTTVGGASAIAVEGELDLETAPQFTEEVEVAVWDTVGAFVLDLSGLSFLDSSGLHALLRARAYWLARTARWSSSARRAPSAACST